MIAAAHPTLRAAGLANVWLAVMAIALTGLTIATPTLHRGTSGWALIATFALGGLGAYCSLAVESGRPRSALIIILAGAVAMRLALLFVELLPLERHLSLHLGRTRAGRRHQPLPLRAQGAGACASCAMPRSFRSSIAPTTRRRSTRRRRRPSSSRLTRLGESVLVMKLGLLALEAGASGRDHRAARSGRARRRPALPPTPGIPLPVWEIAGNGHVDAAMIALSAGGLAAVRAGRTILAGVAVTLGALIKPTALLALPVVLAAVGLAACRSPSRSPSCWPICPTLSVGAGVLGFPAGLPAGGGLRLRLRQRLQAVVAGRAVAGPLPHGGTLYTVPRRSRPDRTRADGGLPLRPLGGGLRCARSPGC